MPPALTDDRDAKPLDGRCHCGALTLRFHPTRPPAELGVRACTCTFCSRRRMRWTSDPGGRVEIAVARAESLSRYRFGTGTAEFLICRQCGYVVAAVSDDGPRAVVNIDVLERAAEFGEAAPMNPDGETLDNRLARRARGWTPAAVTVTG